MVSDNMVQILEYKGEGFLPLVNYETWRVAILRYIDELRPENISYLERHLETDEVFVLLEGECRLLISTLGEHGDLHIDPIDMEPLKLYNIRKGVFHSHTLSEDATVLVIENKDTGNFNSERIYLNEIQKELVCSQA